MSQVDALPLVAELLERIAFLMPTGVDTEPPSTWAVVAEVIWHRVDGQGQGCIQVALDANAASAAATNMLGLDPAVPPAANDMLDATKEMANVLAGNLLPAIYGDAECSIRERPSTESVLICRLGKRDEQDCQSSLSGLGLAGRLATGF